MTSQGSAHGRFTHALQAGNLGNAEDAARELGWLSLENALSLVHLYAEAGSAKYEKAALRYLERHLAETSPMLLEFAHLACLLAEGLPAAATARWA